MNIVYIFRILGYQSIYYQYKYALTITEKCSPFIQYKLFAYLRWLDLQSAKTIVTSLTQFYKENESKRLSYK